ncbi:MAG TPA: hypothetical protein VM509_07180, partial [Planctomycetota bacterium]|nr:hypothetical protein [Planctomycetota bacterium]
MHHPAVLAAFVLTFSSFAAAQTDDPAVAIGAWRSAHGDGWTADVDPRTGFARSLYGGHTAPETRLRDERAALSRARALIVGARAALGIDPSTLVDERALFLPLSSAGTTDKFG